jgi:hypothetical protein
MPKKCKPTEEAIIKRVDAVNRHARINHYTPWELWDISVFGLKTTQKKGRLTMNELIEELSNSNL